MSDKHDFCRTFLTNARQDAKAQGIELPKGMTAIRATTLSPNKWFTVEARGVAGALFSGTACCAFERP